ncbi:primase homolog protein [Triticum aestivum]|nr:primase homolog protein-like [Triticum aestivum]
MPPRPSLQSLLLMAASTSAGAGGSGLLAAARRRFPAAFAAPGGQRIRLLHSFSSRTRLPRRAELACCFGTAPAEAVPAAPAAPRSRNGNATVLSMEYIRACEERIGQVVEKMKKEGIDMSRRRIGAFQRKICPKCEGGPTKDRSLSVFIRENGTHGNWTCFRASCGWKGSTQPDGVLKAYQANKDAGNENESDEEVKANQPVKVVRKPREEDLCLEPLCDEVVEKMKKEGIDMSQVRIGAFQRMICPKCKGGPNKERSLSVFIRENGTRGNWTCFRASCGWKGYTQPDGVSKAYQANKDAGNENGSDQEVKANQPVKVVRKLREEDLSLGPLCDELVTYFSERMISAKTLRRNNVSQRKRNDKIVIAFTYRRDEVLVGCKYMEVSKRFSQEVNTEKIFYGLDDIKQARDIIIVEGEIDKLSMEEAGYRNCVSVPHGAPAKVSKKLPDKDHDKKYLYLWNCKEYLDPASRIILATDADPPGQALAEELARRLGKERCWRVKWPKKSETEFYKDANEVLVSLGPQALKEVIQGAELFGI